MTSASPITPAVPGSSWRQILSAFLLLGCTSFGGPVAHLGHFRREFVERRRWLDAHAFADLVALCQVLPGPASSQVGLAIGLMRGGAAGAMAAWLGFTLPSAILMLALSQSLGWLGSTAQAAGVVHGLKLAAAAVVAQALWSMARTHCPDRARASLAALAAAVVACQPGFGAQLLVCIGGALAGLVVLHSPHQLPASPFPVAHGARAGWLLLGLFLLLLLGLPLAAALSASVWLRLADIFYRAGALVFGGGHVVLPVLQSQIVQGGWLSNDVFLAGYGAAQALPGPLFTVAAFLGGAAGQPPLGLGGALVAVIAIFLPGALLVAGSLPLWASARRHAGARRAMLGVNAAVVGLLLGAFHGTVWTPAVHDGADFAAVVLGCVLLVSWRLPSWALVALALVLSLLRQA
ncbi:MAG: chromate efflux transporter [Pseudomonadota bacterium]|nr:chromate efflux transporter [Pseudomonadota bacterium]